MRPDAAHQDVRPSRIGAVNLFDPTSRGPAISRGSTVDGVPRGSRTPVSCSSGRRLYRLSYRDMVCDAHNETPLRRGRSGTPSPGAGGAPGGGARRCDLPSRRRRLAGPHERWVRVGSGASRGPGGILAPAGPLSSGPMGSAEKKLVRAGGFGPPTTQLRTEYSARLS